MLDQDKKHCKARHKALTRSLLDARAYTLPFTVAELVNESNAIFLRTEQQRVVQGYFRSSSSGGSRSARDRSSDGGGKGGIQGFTRDLYDWPLVASGAAFYSPNAYYFIKLISF